MVRPVARRHRLDRGARHVLSAEHRQLRAERRVVEVREGFIAELERLVKPGDQNGLGVFPRHLSRARRRLHSADRAAEEIVPLSEMRDDVAERHLRFRRFERILLRGHQVGGGHQVLGHHLGVVPERLGDR
jgi:hypothetical protein